MNILGAHQSETDKIILRVLPCTAHIWASEAIVTVDDRRHARESSQQVGRWFMFSIVPFILASAIVTYLVHYTFRCKFRCKHVHISVYFLCTAN